MCPLTDPVPGGGNAVELYGGWIWPFIRVKRIWDEIFSNAGFTITGGDILQSDLFEKLYMPISSRAVTDSSKYLYSMYWIGAQTIGAPQRLGQPTFNGIQLIKGTSVFKGGYYHAPYDGTYKFIVNVASGTILSPAPSFAVYKNAVWQGQMTLVSAFFIQRSYEYELSGVMAGDSIQIWGSATTYYYWFLGVTEIKDAQIAYNSIVDPRLYLPSMTQTDFIKMICNLFALIPDVNPRDRTIRFWNYIELYDNISIARNWSAYLSERDDEVEFKYGEYAQHNYLKYKESGDVIPDNGKGDMEIDDTTLKESKDIIQLNISTCDYVTILATNFSVDISRINFNKWNDSASNYDAAKNIDPRIVYIDFTKEIASPLYQKEFWIRENPTPLVGDWGVTSHQIITPKKASSSEVAFSNLIYYYASLSRMMTRANIRKMKFNLPVYEVAGFKHNIPVYLSQYKAYFYVNKINNYIAGQL
jgi:hypothetical protein